MMTVLSVTVVLAVLVLIVSGLLLCWWITEDALPSSSDPVVKLDEWTEERRKRLADLQHPAAKFIEARRKQR